MLIPASVLVKALSFCACFVLLQPHERTKLEHRARPTRLRVASWVMGLNTKAIGVGIHSPNDFAFLNMSSFGNKKWIIQSVNDLPRKEEEKKEIIRFWNEFYTCLLQNTNISEQSAKTKSLQYKEEVSSSIEVPNLISESVQ